MLGKKLLFFALILSPLSSYAEDKELWLNELSCENYTEKETCDDLYVIMKDLELSNYEMMTFDNQLKKVTHLLHKNKDRIALKRFDRLFESFLEYAIEESDRKKLNNSRDMIWELLKNYSVSDEYTPNPKYKI